MRAVIDAVRRPEYTGENRCWPCTAVNVALLAVVAGVLGAAGYPVAALAATVAGAAVVVLRGYLVPYTPRVAPRLVEGLPGDPFHPGPPRANGSLGTEDVDPEALLSTLVEAGVVEPRDETLELSPEFRQYWHAELDTLAAMDDEELAEAVLAAAPTAADAEVVRGRNRRRVVLRDRDDAEADEVWLSRPIAVADAAAVRALPDSMSRERRAAAAQPLRMFLESCPTCGGPVEESTTAVCCGGLKNPRDGPDDVLVCEDCGARLFTF